MIRILSFRAKNFLSFEDLAYCLPDSTLTIVGGVILGDDSKSNGAGKSAFWEVVPYALYGKTVRGVSGGDVIRRGQTSCDVSLLLNIDNNRYEIQRGREKGKPILRVSKNGVDITQVDSVTTQGMIESSLGMSYELFINSVLFGQGLSYRFVQAPDAEKKEIFEQLLSLDWLRDAQVKAKEILNSAKIEWTDLDRKRAEAGFQISGLEEEMARWVGSKASSFNTFFARLEETQKELSGLGEEMEGLLSEQEESDSELMEIKKKDKEIAALLDKVRMDSRLYVSAHGESWSRKLLQAKQAISEKARMAGVVCPTCEQVVSPDHVGKVVAQMNERGMLFSEYVDKDRAALRDWNGFIQVLTNEAGSSHGRLFEAEEKQGELGMKISKLEGEVNRVETDMALLRKEGEDFKNWQRNKEEIGAKIAEQKIKVSEYGSAMDKKTKEMEILGFWVDGFGNRGVKSLMLDSVTEWMNKTSESFSAKISGGEFIPVFSSTSLTKAGLERESFSVGVKKDDIIIDYKSISGGEKRRVDVIVLLTLCKLLNTTAGKDVNLLVFDEVFESLDSSGIEDVVNVLREFKNEGKCVYVISHQEEARSLFEEEIFVVKNENGVSSVEEVG